MPATRRKLNPRDASGAEESTSGSSLLPLTPSQQTHAGALASTTPPHTPLVAVSRRSATAASSPYARTPTSSHRAQRTPTTTTTTRLGVGRRSEPPSSPAMRAIGGLFGLISPFSRLNAKRSAAFGTPEAIDAQQQQQQQQQYRDAVSSGSGSTTHLLSSGDQVAASSNGLPRSSTVADYAVFTQQSNLGTLRASQSTPAGLSTLNGNNILQHYHSPQPRVSQGHDDSPQPLHSPHAGYDEYEERIAEPIGEEEDAQARPAQPGDSPLARNYELLSRFFAEKAAPEHGQTLTEIEVQGCVRLLEESMAGELDLDRMRAAAAFRNEHAWSSIGSSVRNGAMRKSPSLPLGAAAAEGWRGGMMRSNAAYQSRPSTSFLAPRQAADKFNTTPTDAKFAKSLANSFSPAALAASGSPASLTAPVRRKPLYLGPGMGRGSVSALARRTARTSIAARPTTSASREATRAVVPAPAEETTKRRRLQQPGAVADAPATFIQPSTPEKQASSALAQDTLHSTAAASPAVVTPARSATASAMLSILSSSPSLPESPRVRRPEVVNPYESTSRLSLGGGAGVGGRKSASPSGSNGAGLSARANALRTAKEETRKRKAEAVEARRKAAEEPRRESALERIERTAPMTPARKRTAPTEMESEDAPAAEPLAGAHGKEAAEKREKEAKKIRATEEARRRLSAIQQQQPSSTSARNNDAAQTSSSSSSAPTPSVASAPFTFAAPKPSQAFAPKKPSPLSLAFKPPPDSPGSSSENEDSRGSGSGTSTEASQNVSAPKLAFNFGASTIASSQREKETTQSVTNFHSGNSATSKSVESAKEDEEMSAPSASPAPAPAPTFSFGKPATPAPVPAKASFNFGAPSSASASQPVTATSSTSLASPRAQALSAPASSLPDFALPLSVASSTPTWSSVPGPETTKARSVPLGELPNFSFHLAAGSKASLEVNVTSAAASASAAASTSSTSFSTPAPASPAEDDAASAVSGSSGSVFISISGAGKGEEAEETKHEVRGKVWALHSGTWKDLGVGVVKVKAAEDGKRRLLVRNEVTGKPTVNFNLYAALTIKQEANVITFTGFAEGQPMNYRTKIKTAEGAAQLKAAMEQEAALCK